MPWIRASSAECVRNSCTSLPVAYWPRRWCFARTQACIWISHPLSPPLSCACSPLPPTPHPVLRKAVLIVARAAGEGAIDT